MSVTPTFCHDQPYPLYQCQTRHSANTTGVSAQIVLPTPRKRASKRETQDEWAVGELICAAVGQQTVPVGLISGEG